MRGKGLQKKRAVCVFFIKRYDVFDVTWPMRPLGTPVTSGRHRRPIPDDAVVKNVALWLGFVIVFLLLATVVYFYAHHQSR